jgi:predicted TIM-barrel fold metal-dependent hydrolase
VNHNKLRPTRRTLLQGAATLTIGSLLEGCTRQLRIVTGSPVAPPSFPSTPLTIDCHCHIFNGTDLQVAQFVSRAAFHTKGVLEELVAAGAEILQELVWHLAPTGDDELEALKAWTDSVPGAPSAGHALVLDILNSPESLGNIEAQANVLYQKTRDKILNSKSLKVIADRGDRPRGDQLTAEERANQMADALQRLMGPTPKPEDAKLLIYQSFQFAKTYPELKTSHTIYQVQAAKLAHASVPARTPVTATASPQPVDLVDPTLVQRLPGFLRYLSEGFQYRTVQVHDYLNTFTSAPNRDVDLMIAHLVDYDWPLNHGSATPTPLWTASRRATQIRVMERITIATYGKVHGFVPFDPFREVAYRADKRPIHGELWSSLDLVKTSIGRLADSNGPAIIGNGMIGVKLYPPMGFAACGNAQLGDVWSAPANKMPDWFGKEVAYPTPRPGEKPVAPFGVRLDDALEELYSWCESNDVPILAHSSASNGPSITLENLALSEHWACVVESHPNLRVCFGHLGSLDAAKTDQPTFTENDAPCSQSGIPCSSEHFIELFTSKTGQAGNRYGDSGFSTPILSDKEGLEQRYDNAYGDSSTAGNRLLPARMMYGTDWNLVMTGGDLKEYMQGFIELASGLPSGSADLKNHSAADRFLGWNAVEYLGLQKTDKTRQRLEAFYQKNGLDYRNNPPVWMSKVDNAS